MNASRSILGPGSSSCPWSCERCWLRPAMAIWWYDRPATGSSNPASSRSVALAVSEYRERYSFTGPQLESRSASNAWRSEEHTSELQSRLHLVCRLLLEKKKQKLMSRFTMTNAIQSDYDLVLSC